MKNKRYLWIGLAVAAIAAMLGSTVAFAVSPDVKAWVQTGPIGTGTVRIQSVDGTVYQAEEPVLGDWTLESWNITGPQGPAGLTGDKGDKGDTGDQGIQGIPGLTGESGEQGPQGDIGPQGPQGNKGDTGNIGPQGPIGLTGDKGDTGDTGATGAIGPAGPQGEPGPVDYRAGTATIPYKSKSVVVTFSDALPDANYVVCIPSNQPWRFLTVLGKTATQFTVSAHSKAPKGGITFEWLAISYK